MNVSLIGSGNLAWHLGPALDNAGYVVKEVYSPNRRHADALTERLYQAETTDSLDFSKSPSTLFIIAVTDSAIKDVATEIVLPEEAVLVHTSASQPLNLLQFAAIPDTGVFLPLQTFSKSRRMDFRNVPIFIESLSERTDSVLMPLAKAISSSVRKVTEVERMALHIASIFATDFSNHMLATAKKILDENQRNQQIGNARSGFWHQRPAAFQFTCFLESLVLPSGCVLQHAKTDADETADD